MPKSTSSNTHTFLKYNPQQLQTLPEFKNAHYIYFNKFQQSATIFLHHFIQLWTPKKSYEISNFIPEMSILPKKVTFDLPGQRIPMHDVDPEILQSSIKNGKTQNLSYISFFNYLFDIQNSPSTLFLYQSPKTQEWYFVQRPDFYLKNFFNQIKYYQLRGLTAPKFCSEIPKKENFEDNMLELVNFKNPWWQIVFAYHSDNQIQSLLTKELFEPYLRMFLTPKKLIEQVAQLYLRNLRPHDQQIFISYFCSLIGVFKKHFLQLLNSEEHQYWKYFLDDHSHYCYQQFVEDIQRSTNGYYNIPFIFSLIQAHAFRLKIPHLLKDCKPPRIYNYPRIIYVQAIYYMLHLMQTEWRQIQYQKKHPYWHDLTTLIQRFEDSSLKIFRNDFPFLEALLIRAIQHHHNDIVKFIFLQNHELKFQSHPFLNPDDFRSKILNHGSTLLIALYYHNKEITTLLTKNYAHLDSHDELKFIDLLTEACQTGDLQLTHFYLNHYPYIFAHPNIQFDLQNTLTTCSQEIQDVFAECKTAYQPSIPSTKLTRRERRYSFFGTFNEHSESTDKFIPGLK